MSVPVRLRGILIRLTLYAESTMLVFSLDGSFIEIIVCHLGLNVSYYNVLPFLKTIPIAITPGIVKSSPGWVISTFR